MRRHQLAQMLIIGAIASAIGIVVALLIDWFPIQASTQAKKVDDLYDVLLIASVPVFVLVEVVVLYSVWQFRMRPGQELEDGAPIHGNTRLEVLWTAVPALLMLGLSTYAYVVLRDIEKAQPNTLKVDVTAQQFAWSFKYRAPGGKTVTSPQLYLPKDRPVEFNIHAVDVLHSFFVPEFRVKKDAVPGITTHVRATPNRTGDYTVVCAELCGLGHATMRQTVHVISPAAFSSWLARKSGGAAPAPAAPSGASNATAAGRAVFTGDAGCSGCHTLADAGAKGTVGPDLDNVLKGKSTAFILESIVKPNAQVAKGFGPNIMPPTFGKSLSKAQLRALVDYLAQVTK